MNRFGYLPGKQTKIRPRKHVIRNLVKELYDEETAESMRILYGGSVKASNAAELFEMPNIDGGLIGGASLNLEEYVEIVNYNN